MVILIILWCCQVLMINRFYQYFKIEELKKSTNDIVSSINTENYDDILNLVINQRDVNIRIIDTSNLENVYSGGDGPISATRDIGDFELLRLYNLAVKNGGEISQNYTYDKENQKYARIVLNSSPEDDDKMNDEEKDSGDGEGSVRYKQEIGNQFFSRRPSFFFNSGRYVDDYLFAKIVTLSDGNELMVIADTQVTPLDSTIYVLKINLEITTVIAFIIALIASFIVSKNISRPIEKLNTSALELAQGNFDTVFSGKGYREIEQLSDTLNYTASELGKIEKFRQELIANVSHDLRTPLTMIGGYAEVMRDIPGENTPENVQVIIDETKRLTDFVNDLLDLSKLQSGMENTNFETVNITQLLDGIRTRYDNLTKNDGYRIEIQADDDAYVVCDANKISQALYNLMDNAVNHTGEDKTVVIRQTVTDDKVRIEISDSGSGIPQEEIPYIWDRYYKADKTHVRPVVGSGIGLSIVKSIFKLHGLVYGVHSSEESGTTFWVEFDREKEY